MASSAVACAFAFGLVGEGERVDAVAPPGVGGPIGEDMPQMATAPGAQDLGARHAEAAVLVLDDGAGGAGPVEAGPARSGLELGAGVEQLGAAPGAMEHALAVDVQQVARPGGLGPGTAQDGVSVPGELRLPFLVGLGDFECSRRAGLTCG